MKKNFLKTFILGLGLCSLTTSLVFGMTAQAGRELQMEPVIDENYFGYVPIEHEEPERPGKGGVSVLRTADTIPGAYDARSQGQVTPVKDQGSYGTCWSFATMAALESSLMSRSEYDNPDLSEMHYIYHAFHNVPDPLGGTENDHFTYTGNDIMNAGGNVLVYFHELAGWKGAVNEDIMPYPQGKDDDSGAPMTQELTYLNDIVHLQQFYKINMQDVESLKQAVMKYGGAIASIYYSNIYMNNETGAYYTGKESACNHSVVIVGWDDDYSSANFKNNPGIDGAWIVKNSWGSSFGKDGYLWVSYAETSFDDTCCVLEGEPADNYDFNYQYDGSYLDRYITVSNNTQIANIFTVKGSEKKEELKAVAFEFGSAEVGYQIQIYKDLGDLQDPTSGTTVLDQPITGLTSFPGYYTISLPDDIYLEPEQTFSVVMTLSKEGEDNIKIVSERSGTWNQTNFTSKASEYESMISYSGGILWRDFGSEWNGNLRIKAFAKNTDKAAYVYVQSIEQTEDQNLEVGQTIQLSAKVAPEEATNPILTWSSENNEIASVDQTGMVTAMKKGTTTIHASAENGTVTGSTQITVYDAVSIKESEAEFLVGAQMQLHLIVNGEEQPVEYNEGFLWSSDDERVVSVSASGLVVGTGVGTTRVRCVNSDGSGEKAEVEYIINIPFQDIKLTDWQYPFVCYVYQNNIMSGKSKYIFDMDSNLTRAEFIMVLYNYAGRPNVVYQPYFTDVREQDWYAKAVVWGKSEGIVSGYGDEFGVADPITREQLIRMLCSYDQKRNNSLTDSVQSLSAYEDVDKLSGWAVESMRWAVEKDIITGVQVRGSMYLLPDKTASRGECATIMKKFTTLND